MIEPSRTTSCADSVRAITGPAKIGAEPEKLAAYLRGEEILPTTLELDLTTECNRVCAECPSTSAPSSHSLSLGFIEWLFASLQERTPGLLLTGGEPTMAPLFARTLALARASGFVEIAVVTNGSRLGRPEVLDALLSHAATVRLSLYDWADGEAAGSVAATLRLAAKLRERIEYEGSTLRIGVSMLTSSLRAPRLAQLARQVGEAGAHWLYFHPLCRKWGQGSPELDDQDGVLEAIAALAATPHDGMTVHVFDERYGRADPRFCGYHAAHFLLVVAADGRNYLAPEVKYQDTFAIADLRSRPASPLHAPERIERIRSVHSSGYAALGSRHRGILYSDWIEDRIVGRQAAVPPAFMFPFIL